MKPLKLPHIVETDQVETYFNFLNHLLRMNPWIILALTLIGVGYLLVVMVMAFKERSMIVNLVALNILVFIYMYFFAPSLITKYALSGARMATGNSHTLFSYMFVHANPMHLLVNCFGLMFFGYNLEKEMGVGPMIMVYMVSGIIAGGIFVITSPERALVVGASGAIFGMMAYLTLIRPLRISPMPFLIPMPVAAAAVLYLFIIIPTILTTPIAGNVAHTAHIGGLIGGSLMAFGMNYAQALKGLAVVILIAVLAYLVPLMVY